MIHQRKILKAIAYAILLCFTSLIGAQPLYAIPANTQLPTGEIPKFGIPDGGIMRDDVNNVMTINQGDNKTSVIEWGNFSIGADAAVNFKGPNGFNSLNYVANGGPISEIYGQLTALGGNIFIANPAGVQIGNSAQINVGSLYVTNKDVGEAVKQLDKTSEESDIISAINTHGVAKTNAELMSLGSITSEKKVTFDGDRIILDTDRLFTGAEGTGTGQMTDGQIAQNLQIITKEPDEVVLGYTAVTPEKMGTTVNYPKNKKFNLSNGKGGTTEYTGYMWVEDVFQLQSMNSNLDGWYALRNAIDANYTASGEYKGINAVGNEIADGKGFAPIGSYSSTQGGSGNYNYDDAFTGRFDGLGYHIFGLNIKERENAPNGVGLFGAVYGPNAVVRNVTLNGGSITGGENVGSAAGVAAGGARVEKITNTADVTGTQNVGGVVGLLTSGNDADAAAGDNQTSITDIVNTGTVSGGSSVGGVIGSANGISLGGRVYNLGGISGNSEVGGLIGFAQHSAIGDGAEQIYNRGGVTGDYNVGGIVGSISDTGDGIASSILNAANYGDVTATSYRVQMYRYNSLVTDTTDTYVNQADAGGIVGRSYGNGDVEANIKISDVSNYGDVTSQKEETSVNRKAGNVGGIVGYAKHTNISNAENSENLVAGAHNVGGVAGYLEDGTISNGGNDGGEITATGARYTNNGTTNFVKEKVSQPNSEEQYKDDELVIIGNIGGIVGYLFGDKAKVMDSGNRGDVHSESAANAGGVAGKADVGETHQLASITQDTDDATISGSYNTGTVRGYTGVGGVAGQMFKGSVADSYNYGTLRSTRTAASSSREPLNMGGIVGDTTALSIGGTVIYDVYNAGQIGDPDFIYLGRHVGGIAGRLSGDLEKAYNTGDIYNGYSTVGGIAGWWNAGKIKNVFNTGNITVVNNDTSNTSSEVGGIAGAAGSGAQSLSFAYNLGTLRSIAVQDKNTKTSLGGIVGRVRTNELTIDNVYTTNNIYAAVKNGETVTRDTSAKIGAMYGDIEDNRTDPSVTNSHFVKLYDETLFSGVNEKNQGAAVITESNAKTYEIENDKQIYSNFKFNNDPTVGAAENTWRMYDGSTLPILNAYTPNMKNSEGTWNPENKYSVQYGTAANPLLTIITANDADVNLTWDDLGIYGPGSVAVYDNKSLTIDGFNVTLGKHFNGTIYSDGALTVNAEGGEGALYNLGSGSRLYGSSVTFDAGGRDAGLYGKITATDGDINIINGGKNVTVLGELSTPAEESKTVTVQGIAKTDNAISGLDASRLNNIKAESPLPTVGEANAVEKTANNLFGDIKIIASGVAELLFGSMGGGKITSGGDLEVKGGDGIMLDSDFHVGGNMEFTSDGEVVLDLSNMGKTSVDHLHEHFLDHFKTDGSITVNVINDDDFLIGLDMWDETAFDFTKYDTKEHKLYEDIDSLELTINDTEVGGGSHTPRNHVFTWIEDAAQLKAVQDAAEQNDDVFSYNFALKDDIDASQLEGYKPIASGEGEAFTGTFDGRGFRIIGLNVDAGNSGDGNAGIFGTIRRTVVKDENGDDVVKEIGTVKDLSVYSSRFTGKGAAGTIAAVNKGTIENVTTFGNTVTVTGEAIAAKIVRGEGAPEGTEAGSTVTVAAAGGIAGVNEGTIKDIEASDTVIASDTQSSTAEITVAGGVAGINAGAASIGNVGAVTNRDEFVVSTSAVISNMEPEAEGNVTHGLGGVAGINEGVLWTISAQGVTNGAYGTSANTANEYVGGIAGVNYGFVYDTYNESAVFGASNVGGIVGKNESRGGTDAGVNLSANAGNVLAVTDKGTIGSNAGGLAGLNYGSITYGRNTGTVTGEGSVGGIVGHNASGGLLEDISNAIAALITGNEAVGGIAGTNEGDITEESNLVNEGTVTGVKYVGGIAGVNKGTIENTNAAVKLAAKTDGAEYFGGIAGLNDTGGTITNATNLVDIEAANVSFVGGIAGENRGVLTDAGNTGDITGGKHVGGIIGLNSDGHAAGRIENSGTVTATEGGAAGIIYENNADLGGEGRELTLVNSGRVIGYAMRSDESGHIHGTGGIIGLNSGNISHASLISTVDSVVEGGWNTGGLIGVNTGTITGGRAEGANGLQKYAYQIYNNGTVSGTHNVGGLIGYNAKDEASGKTGSLTAGYNTGRVTGAVNESDTLNGKGENVGGVAGTNLGILDQIFNFVMMRDGKDEISGTSNVGGLVGSNSGTLTNAYNDATAVTANGANGIAGSAAGANSGTIANVYATNTTGRLIGSNNGGTATNAYSFAAGDESATAVIPALGRFDGESYEGFDFGSAWKIYDGWTNPMLKVFLTQAYIAADGSVVAGDGLEAYNHNNRLIGGRFYADAGLTSMDLYSYQIADGYRDGQFYPNWLGYDIENTPHIIPTVNIGHLHWLHRGGDRERNFRERKAEIYFHEGGMVHEETL